MATDKAVPARAQRSAVRQFIVNAALLSLIDPVRGEPTKNLLDKSISDDFLIGQELKEKFLDSFALVCSTSSSGAETASAVCLEQNSTSGVILRVARNRGLSQKDRKGLEKVLEVLTGTACGAKPSSRAAESEMLRIVVDLDRDRIISLLTKLKKSEFRNLVQKAISRIPSENSTSILRDAEFKSWIKTCPFVGASIDLPGSSQLIFLIDWASQARWVYPKELQALLSIDQRITPPWLETLYKIARYHGAVKSMVKIAVKQPELFAGIQVRAIEAPAQESFSLGKEKTPLRTALQQHIKGDVGGVMEQLAQRCETFDAEERLRKTCRLNLTLHAEIQLAIFYDNNPALVPKLPLMGTSKKACYLCHEFLQRHPLRLRVSACHQKIYPSWMPPSSRPQDKNKIFWKLSKHIERLTAKELKTGLTAPRRPRNRDSTAGPTLTTTAAMASEFRAQRLSLGTSGLAK